MVAPGSDGYDHVMTWAVAAAVSGYLTVVVTLLTLWVRSAVAREGESVRREIADLRGEVRVVATKLDGIEARVNNLERGPGLLRS